jgi:hypothetical protein
MLFLEVVDEQRQLNKLEDETDRRRRLLKELEAQMDEVCYLTSCCLVVGVSMFSLVVAQRRSSQWKL